MLLLGRPRSRDAVAMRRRERPKRERKAGRGGPAAAFPLPWRNRRTSGRTAGELASSSETCSADSLTVPLPGLYPRGQKTGSHGHPQGRDGGIAPRLPLGCWADGRTEVVPAYGGRPLGNEHEKPRGGRRAVGGARVRGLPEGRDSTGMGSACAAARGRAWGEQGGGPSRTCQRAHALAHTHALTHPLRAAASQEGTRLDCGGLEGAAVSQPFTRHREERALRRLQRPQDVWSRADAQDVAFGVQQSRLGPHRPAVAPARWPPQW